MFTTIVVELLGKIRLVEQGRVLDEDALHSDKLTKLLIYILIHRDHPNTIQELSEALWSEDETDEPSGALKNLMYRLRTLLKKNLGEHEYIMTGRGVYYWNPELPVQLDIEQFEKLCEKAKKSKDVQEQIESYEQAIAMYKGDFMSNITDKHWVVTLSANYHSMLLSSVKALAEIYMETKEYEEAERVCTSGLKYDAVDEWLHSHRIMALIRQNKQKMAMECYEQSVNILYDALGTCKSAQPDAVHQELLKMSKGTDADEIWNVHGDMKEEQEPVGAYICGYPVFKEIYRLDARKIQRLKESEYVMLLSLQHKENTANEQMEKFMMTLAMNQMEDVLKNTLRIGDVASKCSDSQYVVLLMACTYENGLLVADRVVRQFMEQNMSKKIRVKTDLEEVTSEYSVLVK